MTIFEIKQGLDLLTFHPSYNVQINKKGHYLLPLESKQTSVLFRPQCGVLKDVNIVRCG